MVVIQLCGGLGNQIWQRAMGYALEALGNEVCFDRSRMDADETRAYALNHWNTEVRLHSPVGQVVQEPDLLYHPELLKNYQQDVTLSGYFQSPSYFAGVEDKIRQAFTLRETPCDKTLAIAREIENSNSVFLHVRRTDNLSARGLAFHGLGSVEYWTRAVQEIFKKVRSPEFFVFSDDIEWCKKQTYFAGATFVDHNSTGVEVDPEFALKKTDNGTEHEDMFLLAKCKHGIMATSTFSWWGAFLGPHQTGGTIIRPSRWFIGDKNLESRDMFPASWAAC